MLSFSENVSLKLYSTMRLGGTARFVCTVRSEEDVLEAVAFAKAHAVPMRVIGHGSNIIWHDEGFAGLLIVNAIDGFELLDGRTLKIGAGMEWDTAVARSVQAGLSGLEYLSLIPGTVGATPVQNVGAYGAEVKDSIVSLRAYDTHEKKFIEISNSDCAFTYRSSRFKAQDSGRFIITSVTFRLQKKQPQPPFYEALQSYLNEHNITAYNAQVIRDAVIAIRTHKMPDPKQIANNGSFFANPVIEKPQYEKLQQDFPAIKGWEISDGRMKVAAGWLIEQAGFKDYHDQETGMATWHSQSLVLINEHATSTKQLIAFKQKIVSAVHKKYNILLEQEPELLP